MTAPAKMSVVAGPARPEPTEGERDDAKQVLSLAIAGIQRERAAADQLFSRGRNFLALAAALFAAVQAAFVSSIGREIGGQVALTHAERTDVLKVAIVGGVLLLVAFGLLLIRLDRGKDLEAVGGGVLKELWLDPDGKHQDKAVVEALAVAAIAEESSWATANKKRQQAVDYVAWASGTTALVAMAELLVLYIGLT